MADQVAERAVALDRVLLELETELDAGHLVVAAR